MQAIKLTDVPLIEFIGNSITYGAEAYDSETPAARVIITTNTMPAMLTGQRLQK